MTAASLGLTPNQFAHAQTIIDVVVSRGLPQRVAVIAMETALDESGLQNYANANNPASLLLPHDAVGSDHGSVGLFQQQVGDAPNSTANWGTTAELMDPATACGKFLNVLVTKPWSSMTNWQAAQAVQVSAIADGSNYEAQDARAQQIVAALWPTPEVDMTPADCLLTLRQYFGSAEGQGRIEQGCIAAINHQHLSLVEASVELTASPTPASTYALDIAERAAKSFLQAFFGVLVPLLVASQSNIAVFGTLAFWQSAVTAAASAGLAAVLSLATSVLSGFRTGTASASKRVAAASPVDGAHEAA